MANYFETVSSSLQKRQTGCQLDHGRAFSALNSQDLSIGNSPVSAEQLAGLIVRIADNSISEKWLKKYLKLSGPVKAVPIRLLKPAVLKQVSDSGALEQMVADVLAANQAMVDDYINTDEAKRKKKLGGFMGQIMKASKGQANPQQVNQILAQKLNELL